MYSDEVLAEMIKLTEKQQNKPLEKEAREDDLRIDMSQFSLTPNPEDDGLNINSFPMMQNVVVAADNDGLDKEILKEKKKATDYEDIIDQAHPETAYMADGPMGTGVVENQNEQHAKILNTIYKMPTGFHFNTLAELSQDLVVLAERLEAKGDLEAVRKVDETLAAIAAKKKSSLNKEAAEYSLHPGEEKGKIKPQIPGGGKRPEQHAAPGEIYSKTKPPKPGAPSTALVVRPQTDMTKAPGTQMTVRPSGDIVTVQKGQPGFSGPAQLGPGKTPLQLGPGTKGGPLTRGLTPEVLPPEVLPPEKQRSRVTKGPTIIDVEPEKPRQEKGKGERKRKPRLLPGPDIGEKEKGKGKPSDVKTTKWKEGPETDKTKKTRMVTPEEKAELEGKREKPKGAEPADKKTTKKPKGGKGIKGKNVLGLVANKMKGKGGKLALLGLLGAGIYALFQSNKSDWNKYLDMAEDEAEKANNSNAKVLVADIRRRYESVNEMMSSAEEAKTLEVDQYLQIDQLISKVDSLSDYADISPEMDEAAKGLAALASSLQEQGAKYFEKGTEEREQAKLQSEEKIKGMKQWFLDQGDRGMIINSKPDQRLQYHLRKFVSNMKDTFGPEFDPKLLTTRNLLEGGDYELLDDLNRIWKSPRKAVERG